LIILGVITGILGVIIQLSIYFAGFILGPVSNKLMLFFVLSVPFILILLVILVTLDIINYPVIYSLRTKARKKRDAINLIPKASVSEPPKPDNLLLYLDRLVFLILLGVCLYIYKQKSK